MTCQRVRRCLSAYIDGELTGQEALAVRAHVAECGACAQERDSLVEVKRSVTSLTLVEPPAGLEARLREAVFARAASPRRVSVPPLAGWMAIAAACAFGTVFLAHQVRPESATTVATDAAVSAERVADQAYVVGSDPLGGHAPILPASFNGR